MSHGRAANNCSSIAAAREECEIPESPKTSERGVSG